MNVSEIYRGAALWGHEARFELLTTLRTPQSVVPTMILPVAAFAVTAFAGGEAHPVITGAMLAKFGIFAAMGPALYGFAIGVAAERDAGLLQLKRVSRLPPSSPRSSRHAWPPLS